MLNVPEPAEIEHARRHQLSRRRRIFISTRPKEPWRGLRRYGRAVSAWATSAAVHCRNDKESEARLRSRRKTSLVSNEYWMCVLLGYQCCIAARSLPKVSRCANDLLRKGLQIMTVCPGNCLTTYNRASPDLLSKATVLCAVTYIVAC